MINKISFKNYKAFESGEIDLKPITILLGANSVGKSSIINMILMLQQTANITSYKSALKLNGEYVGMGECENIFTNKDISKKLTIEFNFTDNRLLKLLNESLIIDLVNSSLAPIRYFGNHRQNKIFNQYFDKNGEIKKNVLSDISIFKNLINALDSISNLEENPLNKLKKLRSSEIEKKSDSSIIEAYKFLQSASKIKDNNFTISYDIQCIKQTNNDLKQHDRLLKVSNITLKQVNKILLSLDLIFNEEKSSYKSITLKSDFINDSSFSNIIIDELIQSINYNSTIFSIISTSEISRDFYFGYYRDNSSALSQTILQILSTAIEKIYDQFQSDSINHISPLRAFPQRYYFLDKSNINTYLNNFDGNSLTEVIKENKNIRDEVNKWLKKFNLNVNVDNLHDIIHKLKIKQNKLDLDITDVGFGISQILPVIVQCFMSKDNSITMIEQPEIHLHPKMQAELADLFIHIIENASEYMIKQNSFNEYYIDDDIEVESNEKCLLIETHSEYLLRRLCRRISEGKITTQKVGIYFISPPCGDTKFNEIQFKNISHNGYFNYPHDFMDERLEKDMISFINAQMMK